jgi:hypothetical protein
VTHDGLSPLCAHHWRRGRCEVWTARRIGRIRIDRENARGRSLRFSLSARSAVARRHEAVHGARALQRPRKTVCTQWMGARLGRRKRPPRASERLRHGHQALREGRANRRAGHSQRCICAPPFRLNGTTTTNTTCEHRITIQQQHCCLFFLPRRGREGGGGSAVVEVLFALQRLPCCLLL